VKVKLESCKSLQTKTNLVFSTKDSIHPVEIKQLLKTEGYLGFSADQFKKEVEDAMKDTKLGIDEEGHSPSKRLRGQMFQAWTHSEEEIPWDDYYVREMKKIIEHYGNKY